MDALSSIYELTLDIAEYLSVDDIYNGVRAGFLSRRLLNDDNFFSVRARKCLDFKGTFKLEGVRAIDRYLRLRMLRMSGDIVTLIKDGHTRDVIDLAGMRTIIQYHVGLACKYGRLDILKYFVSLGFDPLG